MAMTMLKNKTYFSDATIIIPTLNEERNIAELLEKLQILYKNVKIIVSDDGSKDRTQIIVKSINKRNPNIHLLDRKKEYIHGLTASVIDGVKKVKTKYLVVMDGDMQHPPEKVREIITNLRENNDIVIGIRKKIYCDGIFRTIMSKTAITCGQIRLLYNGLYCHDVVSGFFGSKASLFQDIIQKFQSKFEKEGYKVLFDLLKLIKKNTKIKEIEYEFGSRSAGKSKINKKHILIYFRSLFK
jgi:dolichol-phosphate mannosyltransferase